MPSEVNIPEVMPDFDSPGNIGSWRQLFAANIGKKIRMEALFLFDGPLRVICGEIYAVGNSYVLLKCGDKMMAADLLAVKTLCFE